MNEIMKKACERFESRLVDDIEAFVKMALGEPAPDPAVKPVAPVKPIATPIAPPPGAPATPGAPGTSWGVKPLVGTPPAAPAVPPPAPPAAPAPQWNVKPALGSTPAAPAYGSGQIAPRGVNHIEGAKPMFPEPNSAAEAPAPAPAPAPRFDPANVPINQQAPGAVALGRQMANKPGVAPAAQNPYDQSPGAQSIRNKGKASVVAPAPVQMAQPITP